MNNIVVLTFICPLCVACITVLLRSSITTNQDEWKRKILSACLNPLWGKEKSGDLFFKTENSQGFAKVQFVDPPNPSYLRRSRRKFQYFTWSKAFSIPYLHNNSTFADVFLMSGRIEMVLCIKIHNYFEHINHFFVFRLPGKDKRKILFAL